MIVEAVDSVVEVVQAFPPDNLDLFARTHHRTVCPAPGKLPTRHHPEPPALAVGAILRPVSISIEAAIRG